MPPRRRQLTRLPAVAAIAAVGEYIVRAAMQWGQPYANRVDFAVYFHAAQRFAAGAPLYSSHDYCCHDYAAMDGQYTYPPTVAIVLRPLVGMGIDDAARVWVLLSHLALLATVVILYRLLREWLSTPAMLWMLALGLGIFEPLYLGLFGLQVANILLLVYTVGAWGFVRNRSALAGSMLAVGAAIKVAPAVLASTALTLRRREAVRMLAAAAISGAVLLGIVWVLVPQTPDYLRILPQFSSGVIAEWNRSLPGVILQVYGAQGGNPGAWFDVAEEVLFVALLALTLWLGRGTADPRRRAAVFGSVLALLPITQGVTWDHHLVNDLLALALLAPSLPRGSRRWGMALLGFLLMCINEESLFGWMEDHGLLHPTDALHTAGFALLMSISLAGMILVWLAGIAALRATAPAALEARLAAAGPAPDHARTQSPAA